MKFPWHGEWKVVEMPTVKAKCPEGVKTVTLDL